MDLPSKKQLVIMLSMQDLLNKTVNPNWKEAGNDWSLAVLLEASEAIDHTGWKWWKEQVPNIPQLKLEIVDIWHFIISEIMSDNSVTLEEMKYSELADLIIEVVDEVYKDLEGTEDKEILTNTRAALRYLAYRAAISDSMLEVFSEVMFSLKMTWSELYKIYIGKHSLNMFRQEHGYKDGSYIKDWSSYKLVNTTTTNSGVCEDNDHLHDIMLGIDEDIDDIIDVVNKELLTRYTVIKNMKMASE